MYFISGAEVSEQQFSKAVSLAQSDKDIQGIFETMACIEHQLPLLDFHLQRLQKSVPEPLGVNQVVKQVTQVVRSLKLPEFAVVKVQYYYSLENQISQRLIEILPMRDYPDLYWQEGVDICLSTERMVLDPAAKGRKFTDRTFYDRVKKEYIAAHCPEALILNCNEEVVEGSKTNVFGLKNDRLITPALSCGGVAGVMRAYILQLATKLGFSVSVQAVSLEEFLEFDAVFVSNALIGLWPVKSLLIKGKNVNEWSTEHHMMNQLKMNIPDGFIHA